MLACVKTSSSRKPNVQLSIPSRRANSTEGTPRSSTQPSPIIDITQEYNRYIQSNSYGEIKSKIHTVDYSDEHEESIQIEEGSNIDLQILNPSQECVQEALQHAKPGTLTSLVSTYFEHSESTSLICVSLLNSVKRTHSLYRKLQTLLSVLPLDSDSNTLTHAQCDRAFDVFSEFSNLENPFPSPESRNFHNIRNSFSHLNQQLNRSISKSRSRVTLFSPTCAGVCLVSTAIGVTIAAIIATHALVALVAAPLLPACISGITKDEEAHLALDAAARGTCFLHYDLNTIDCLVDRLYCAVEDDKNLIRIGMAGGCDRHPIHLLSKQLYKNHNDLQKQLVDFEEHICLCIAAINRTRSKLLEEIHRR